MVYTNVKELPAGILKLRKLCELNVVHEGNYSNNFAVQGFKASCKIGGLHSLEILKSIDADNDEIVREIGKLTQLSESSITKLRREDGKQLCSFLGKLANLRKLLVDSIKEDEILDLQHPISPTPPVLQCLRLRGRLEKVPQLLPSLQGLTIINLFGRGLREDPLESFQHLSNLMSIILFKAYEGGVLCFKAGGFQKLNRLELTKLRQLKQVKVEKEALPCLQILAMADCKLLDELPSGTQNLSKLRIFDLYNIGDELINKLKDKGSEEYQKVTQVPRIVIGNWIDGRRKMRFL